MASLTDPRDEEESYGQSVLRRFESHGFCSTWGLAMVMAAVLVVETAAAVIERNAATINLGRRVRVKSRESHTD